MSKKITLVSLIILLSSGCGETPPPAASQPPPQNVVSRDDIIDFCDSVPQWTGDSVAETERRTRREAEMLGFNGEQMFAMVDGAASARLRFAVSGTNRELAKLNGSFISPDDEKSFQSICKAKVREELFKLSEK